jgi:PAS domain S-box-containing protein
MASKKPIPQRPPRISAVLTTLVALMLGGLGLYEGLLHFIWHPGDSGYVHVAAVLFPTIVAVLVAYYFLSVYDRMYRRMREEMDERFQAETALEEARQELELRVDERTTELTRLNEEMVEEISDRKRVESELLTSEARVQAIASQMPCILWTTDRELRVTYVVGAGYSRLNVNPYDFLGMTVYDILRTSDHAHPMVACHLRALRGVSSGYEAGYEDRDFEVRVEPLRDGQGGITGSVGLAMDTTGRKEVENALRQSEERYRSLFERMLNGIAVHEAVCDDEGKIVDSRLVEVNPAFEAITGLAARDIVGRTLREVVPGVEEYWLEAGARACQSGTPVYCENYCAPLGKWLAMSFYRTETGHFAALMADVTDRMEAVRALSESESKFRDLAEKSLVGVYLIQDDLFRYVNPAFARIHGFSIDDIVNRKGPKDVVMAEDWPVHSEILRKRLWGDVESGRFEFRIVTPKDEVRHVEVRGSRTMYQGRPAIIGTLLDVTGRREAEIALKESEERFRNLVERAADAVFLHDTEGRIVEVNRQACESTGYSREELLALQIKDVETVFESTSLPVLWEEIGHGSPVTLDGSHRRKDGSTFPVEIRVGAFEYRGRQLMLALIRDVTERRRAEEALREREAKLNSIFRVAPVGIGTVIDRVFWDVNNTILDMTGYARDELIGRNARMLYPTQEDFDHVGTVKYRQIAERGTGTVETRWLRKDGQLIDVLLSSTPLDPADHSKGVTFTALDITERKQAAEALQKAKEYAENLLETANVMVIGVDAVGAVTVFNREAERITGYIRQEVLGRNLFEDWARTGHYDYLQERFVQWQAGRLLMPLLVENVLYTKTGEEVFISWRINDIREQGRLVGLIGFGMNISERKMMEQEIVARNQELLLLRELSEIIQQSTSLDEGYREVVEHVSLATGFPLVTLEMADASRDMMVFKAAVGIELPTGGLEMPLSETPSGVAVRERRPFVETDLASSPAYATSFLPGLVIQTLVSVPLLVGDRAIGALSLGHQEKVQVRDSLVSLVMALANEIAAFTDRRRMGEELRRSEEKYRTLVESTSDAILMLDLERRIVSSNQGFFSLFGLDTLDAAGLSTRVIHPDEASWRRFGEEAYGVVEREGTFRAEWDLMRANGTEFPAETVTSAIRRSDGTMTGYVAIIRDIAERRKVMEALQESEKRYRTLVDRTPDPILVHEFGSILFANAAAARLFGVDKPEALLGRDAMDFVPPDARRFVERRLQTLDEGATDLPFVEQRCLRVDGGEVYVEASPVSILFYGRPAVLTIFRDITERKQAQERILASLEEKEVLLKEIHHRVKNNLQIVSSLLYLQSRKTEDDTVLQVLRESQNRIKSMALIHEKLYHSHDFTQIDFADYIRSLVGHLMHTYRTVGGVSLKVDVGQVSFGLDKAIPLGLIINELVSNALKYAFPRDKRGEITVSLREEAGREDTLIVHDNGVGFPEDIDFEHSPSLGLQLVCTLAKQVDGVIRLDRDGGTTFTVRLRRLNDA